MLHMLHHQPLHADVHLIIFIVAMFVAMYYYSTCHKVSVITSSKKRKINIPSKPQASGRGGLVLEHPIVAGSIEHVLSSLIKIDGSQHTLYWLVLPFGQGAQCNAYKCVQN